MKTIISIFALSGIISLTACNNSNQSKESADKKSDSTSPTNNNNQPKAGGSVDGIVYAYIRLKNALANDDGNGAAAAGNDMTKAIANVDESSLETEQKKVYEDLKADIREHGEHISGNASNIAHQREHFDLLSRDMIELVKVNRNQQTLYRDFCPMYNNKKGAFWISESKEIKNPYYGKEMPKCGEVKEEIKPKG